MGRSRHSDAERMVRHGAEPPFAMMGDGVPAIRQRLAFTQAGGGYSPMLLGRYKYLPLQTFSY
jgi:hypothetical protein